MSASSDPDGSTPAHPPPRRPAALEWREERRGRLPGDRYIRIARHHGFRYRAPDYLVTRARTAEPRSGLGRALARLKRVIVGQPLATEQAIHERLSKTKALAVLSSDALSSVAYGTEEILRALLIAGVGALTISLEIGAAILVLLLIVGLSYRQTIKAYPQGGGSYIVAKDNLGVIPGLVAAAALLIDYILTVAVSVAAGISAITSAFPMLHDERVLLSIAAVAIITLVNLRGVRESGTIFMVPTYAFIIGIAGLILVGLWRHFTEGIVAGTPVDLHPGAEGISLFLILRAFASGSVALTGVEAISDGVPAFKPPEWQNARTTLSWMIAILAFLFGGITLLANLMHVVPSGEETVVSQIARTVFGQGPIYLYIQFATMLILIMAANTAYSDFPRLAYFLGRDRFLPRQFTFRGDRLAYSNGIIVLGLFAALLLYAYHAEVHSLIPLYAVGVFTSFTLSQFGMVVRWRRLREPGWQRGMLINAVGAAATAVVLVIQATTKFLDGAWMVVVLIPLIVFVLHGINRHYQSAARQLAPETPLDPAQIKHTIIVPIAALNRVALQALAYARSMSPNVTAIHVVESPEEAEAFRAEWERLHPDARLVIIESPYRSLIGPLLAYIDEVDRSDPTDTLTVVLPEFIAHHWWEQFLHNQTALRLKAALLFRPGTVVVSVPYHLHD